MTCSGLFTALVTPFDAEGSLDKVGLQFHIKRQKEAKVQGLVVFGTTGEGATLTPQEKKEIMHIVKKEASGLPVMAGCGTSSTSQTLDNIQMAADQGVDFALVISPFYNRPTQEGLFRHFEALSKKSPLPIFVYNNPPRTGVNIEVDTLLKIASLPQIRGIKDCSGNLTQISEIVLKIKQKYSDFVLFAGDDPLTLPIMVLGGDGVISGGANLYPKQMGALVKACQNRDFHRAKELHLLLTPIFKALTLESNPIPLKAALELAHIPAGHPRLPLTPLNPKYIPLLKELINGQAEPQFF